MMTNMSLRNIARACDGTYVGDPAMLEKEVSGIVIDSRKVEEDYLFIPIRGERVDGHDFIPQVFQNGACCVLSEMPLTEVPGPYIQVKSSEDALKRIAAFYRQSLSIKVVGITGSVGKTSTKEMIASVVSQKYCVHKTAGNFNNEIGLPLTIFGIRQEHEVAILEMGISDFNEMHRLSEIANPDICVITNIGLCHLENLGSRDGILQAKTECFAHMKENGTVILNGDDDKLATRKVVNGKDVVFYGFGNQAAMDAEGHPMAEKTIYATNVENLGFEGMKALIHTPEGEFMANISIPGEHNVYNALAATAVGLELGLSLAQIQTGIGMAKTIAGRTNLLKIHDMNVIDDCYNANPVSMEAALDVLSHAKGRTIAVLGDMGELGTDEKELHYSVGRCAAMKHIHTVFCAGTLAKEYQSGIESLKGSDGFITNVFYFEDREKMTEALLGYAEAGDNILIKASHFMEFPKVVEALTNRK